MLNRWQAELITGNDDFDKTHSELFNKVDELMKAARELRGKEELGKFLWFLQRYVRKHFNAEEVLQRSLGFSGYAEHKNAHDSFVSEVREIQEQYSRDGESTVLIVKVIRVISDWIKTHINSKDREVALFLRQVLDR